MADRHDHPDDSNAPRHDPGIGEETSATGQRFKGKVTLTTLSELYGTKDSLPCSVKRTYNSDNLAAANWPIPVGSTATLCLN